MLGHAIKTIVGISHAIKYKWNYLVHYEAYLKAQVLEIASSQKQLLRQAAKEIAAYLDNKRTLKKELILLEKEAKQKRVDKTKLPNFNALYQKTLSRDKYAYELMAQYKFSFEKMTTMQTEIESIKFDSMRYERYLTIKATVESHGAQKIDKQLISKSACIDLKKDYIHITQLAVQYQKKPRDLYQQIQKLQKIHQQNILKACIKDYPVLAQYHQLTIKRGKLTGFKAEQLDKILQLKAKEIIENHALSTVLKQTLKTYLDVISARANKPTYYRHHE